uniref:oligosaccharide flippase family protein n=1 Tax=Rheinheimera sp. TaxID=1869214 RepID=UPI004048158A
MFKTFIHNQKVNFASLIVMQGANAILPLLVFPILFVKMGAEQFSQLVVSEALSIIVLAFVLYGFDIAGVNKLTKVDTKDDEELIFFTILYSRITLFLISIPLGCIVYLIYGRGVAIVFACWLFIPLSHIFQSAYFCLYKQVNFPAAFFNVISRLLSLLIIMLSPDELLTPSISALIIGGLYLLGSLSCFTFIVIFWGLKYKPYSLSSVCSYLRESFSIFSSNLSVLLYRDFNVIMLSIVFRDASAISVYALAEKCVKSIQAVFRPISQFFTPKVIKALKPFLNPNFTSFILIWKYTKWQVYLALAVCFTSLLTYIVFLEDEIVFTEDFTLAFPLVVVMLFSICFGIVNYMFGMIGLNCLSKSRYLAMATLITATISVLLCMALSNMFGAIGAAATFIIAEAILLLLIFYKYKVLR